MSKQNQYPELRSIFDKNREVVKMLKAERQLNESHICFRAAYFKLGRKIAESKDNPSMSAFTTVINGRYQVCEPDSITITWHNAETEEKLFEQTFPVLKHKIDTEYASGKSLLPVVHGLNGFSQGLGEAEVNHLVEKRLTELRSKEDHERLKDDNMRLNQKLSELEVRNSELESTIAAKETTEYYMRIIGIAIPGVAKFFSGASILNSLSGPTEKEPSESAAKKEPKDEREQMIQMLEEYMHSDLNEQEVATMYMLFMEIQKDKSQIQKILTFLTKSNHATTTQNKNQS